MRTAKFRGKQHETGEWLVGDLIHFRNDAMILPLDADWFDFVPRKNNPFRLPSDRFVVDPATVGQFTGLTDKNGKEIYEGDIISSKKHPQIKHLIFYNEKQGKFMAGFYGNTNIYDFGVCGVDIPVWMAEKEVIDNIHDNPGLIEKGGEE